jgi:hypothetical protein
VDRAGRPSKYVRLVAFLFLAGLLLPDLSVFRPFIVLSLNIHKSPRHFHPLFQVGLLLLLRGQERT